MSNKSEIPVKLSVTSTAKLDTTNPISLVSTKAAAEESTEEDGEAWLAVAAQTSDGKYIEDASKGIKDLTEADANVTTFVQDETTTSEAKAEQVYYLNAEASPTVTYTAKKIEDADGLAAAKKIAYAQFYDLTEIDPQPTDNDTLQAAVDNGDIYEIEDSNNVVKFIEKGTAAIRLVTGQNAVASKITSVKVDGTTTSYSVTSSGAVMVNGISGAGSHKVVIVHDGITYQGTATAS